MEKNMDTQSLLRVMEVVVRLKEVSRTGWNKVFPAGMKVKTRRVENAESVADHSWGLAILTALLAEEFELDLVSTVIMALIHDINESRTGDIITATIEDPKERARVKERKKHAERKFMREFCGNLPEPHRTQWLELWEEYAADEKTPRAQFVSQLDKIEACFQAVWYRERGHVVDPMEFINFAMNEVKDPKLSALLTEIGQRGEKANLI
jgi:putative hydrolase of HD superfamily